MTANELIKDFAEREYLNNWTIKGKGGVTVENDLQKDNPHEQAAETLKRAVGRLPSSREDYTVKLMRAPNDGQNALVRFLTITTPETDTPQMSSTQLDEIKKDAYDKAYSQAKADMRLENIEKNVERCFDLLEKIWKAIEDKQKSGGGLDTESISKGIQMLGVAKKAFAPAS